MSGRFKDSFKYSSITTPDFEHPSFCFGAEILTYRQALEDGYELPEFFWRKATECPDKYKQAFNGNVECMRKLMKVVPPHFVIQCATYSKNIKYANYGYITATVKNRWKVWNERVGDRLKGLLKQQIFKNAVSEEIEFFSENMDTADFNTTKKSKKVML